MEAVEEVPKRLKIASSATCPPFLGLTPHSAHISFTLVQNRFLQSEIRECPPIIDVGEPFLAGSLAKRCPQEGNPIVQVSSLFNQLLQHFPRTEFAALVKKHAAERDAKGFTCWTQFVSMLFCQLGRKVAPFVKTIFRAQ